MSYVTVDSNVIENNCATIFYFNYHGTILPPPHPHPNKPSNGHSGYKAYNNTSTQIKQKNKLKLIFYLYLVFSTIFNNISVSS
jgi:hypothetical protein